MVFRFGKNLMLNVFFWYQELFNPIIIYLMNVEVPCQRLLNIINRLLHVYCLVSGGG